MSDSPGRAPLVLAPFRGLRFDPAVVGDPGSVVSPPYDMLDAETVRDLEAGNGRNIVRLILSRGHERPYLAVRRRLDAWRAEGCLVPDPEPALYLYEYTVDGVAVRGLVGLLGLAEEAEGVVLPHEDVMPDPVEDRTVLMRTTGTNLEPILLLHHGPPGLRELLARVAGDPPLADLHAADHSTHRLWAITDPGDIDAAARLLAPGQALIADGHHRYSAYLALRRALRGDAPRGGSPWDYGLAMLVDQSDHPLSIAPIHRSVSGLTLSDVVEVSEARGDRVRWCHARDTAVTALSAPPESAGSAAHGAATRVPGPPSATFVLSDGRSWITLETSRTHTVDAAVLQQSLLPAWQVDDEQVGYHHSLDQALRATAREPGVVVGVRPPSLRDVMAAAERGERLPRKSTSFTPKPRMGLVMRDLRDG